MKRILAFFALMLMALPAPAGAALENVPASTQQLQMSFAPLVKKTSPAVVNIYTKRVVREQMRIISPFFNDPFFNQFFGGAMPKGMNGGVRERVEQSLGSGVIVDSSGIVATNSHVISGATEIIVVTADGREYTAEKKLADDQTDLAILQINAKGASLPALPLTDSDALEVGDIVLAIGNPFGLGQTVTSGIISGLSRTGVSPSDYGFFIQTDAAINPGNSGGALIDINGNLVGINSMIFSRSGGSLGIGFAIPANMVRTVVEASKTGDRIVRPWTGFAGQSITSDMIESLGLERAAGVLVNRVTAGGPAAHAGVQVGDIITHMNGFEVRDPAALHYRLATVPMGKPVQLTLRRKGHEMKLPMIAQAAPENPPRTLTQITDNNPLQGAVVARLSPALAQELGGMEQDTGVVIMSADKGISTRIGVRPHDIVTAVNGRAVKDIDDLKRHLKDGSRGWAIEIMRGERVFTIRITK